MERMLDPDSGLRRLERKHADLSAQLERLQEQRFLTEAEKLEEVKIKKLKLAIKDQMENGVTTLIEAMINQELDRPARAEVSAFWRRNGSAMRAYVQVLNLDDAPVEIDDEAGTILWEPEYWAGILPSVMGSDHCPVSVRLD